MRISRFLIAALLLLALSTGAASAALFEMTDGTSVEGEVVQGRPEALQIRVGDGEYKKLAWDKLSQKTLRMLAEDSKLKLESFVEPYIEIPDEERIKRTEVEIKGVPRLDQPVKQSLLGAMFGSPLGILMLLLIYAANIYAGYEVAVVRAYPPGWGVVGAAILPIIAPVIFLFLPTRLESAQEHQQEEASAPAETPPSYNPMAADPAPGTPAPHAGHAGHATPSQSGHAPAKGGLSISHAAPAAAAAAGGAAANAPAAEVYKRGQFTFNRRFIETKFSGFFGVVRRDSSKDMVLFIKTARGNFTATRISRIASSDMHIEERKGEAAHEVAVPFGEIQEIHLKHKDAA